MFIEGRIRCRNRPGGSSRNEVRWDEPKKAAQRRTRSMNENAGHRNRANRVTPFGDFQSSSARGAFLGNRGDLHALDGSIDKPYRLTRWISCTLAAIEGQRVSFDTPGRC